MEPIRDRLADEYEAVERGVPAEVVGQSLTLQHASRRCAKWFLDNSTSRIDPASKYRTSLLTNSMVGLAAWSIAYLLTDHGSDREKLDEILTNVRGLSLRFASDLKDVTQGSKDGEEEASGSGE